MTRLLRASLAASAAIIAFCAIALAVHALMPRQPRLYGEIYTPLAIPECNDGARLVSDDEDGFSVSSCEPADVDPDARPHPVEP